MQVRHRFAAVLAATGIFVLPPSAYAQTTAAAPAKPYAAVGLFIGAIEEGARIFTPVRLLPFGHPEAGQHEFPTAQQLHGTEFSALLWLGEQVGFHLWPTLERYPTMPDSAWPYPDQQPPPDSIVLHRLIVSHRSKATAPLPGLRAAVFDERALVAFIIDTRGLSLRDRGLQRATAMGLDLNRADFLQRIGRAVEPGAVGLTAVVWDR